MIRQICEYFRGVEQTLPLASHKNFQKTWRSDVEQFIQDSSLSHSILDAVLEFRSEIHEAACSTNQSADPGGENDWSWLITTKQVEQKTIEWYNETRNLITASEIAGIWKGPRTRASLVVSKAATTDRIQLVETEGAAAQPRFRLAVPRAETRAMDWGIRYEPVVKEWLEKNMACKIQELGRIRHRTVERLAASPDGLVVEGPTEILGNLIEIKCPPSREIKDDTIPFEYWCQMQIQMEVCDRDVCEFVEAKFKEVDGTTGKDADPLTKGTIQLLYNTDTGEMKYSYNTSDIIEEPWSVYETYEWHLVKLRKISVKRDKEWFASIQPDLQAFWADVEGCRAGTWQAPPPRQSKKQTAGDSTNTETLCGIVD